MALRPWLALLAALLPAAAGAASPGPRPAGAEGYVDERQCGGCHPEQRSNWQGSKHAKAMQPATAGSVRGDFAGRQFREGGETFRFYQRRGQYFVDVATPGQQTQTHRIRYTFGVHPLQQYLVAAPGGRLQALTVAWDVTGRRWFSLHEGPPPEPGEPMHWRGRYQNWNAMCAECHSTALRKGYDPASDSYRTSWALVHVGCQGCHGPGRDHVRAARRGQAVPMPVGRLAGSADQADQCGRCHGRRVRLTDRDGSGEPLLDHFLPETLRARLFHADGQQLGEVFEYASFRQSRMYQAGVRCTDCHDAHGGRPRLAGNDLCRQCHSPEAAGRFQGLRPIDYQSADHHFHPPGSSGSLCVNCHMPSATYMGVHQRRDHSIRIPRPDLSAGTGAPDACTRCHADRTAGWAAAEIGKRHPRTNRASHWGESVARARRGDASVAPALVDLALNVSVPAVVRATALEELSALGGTPPEASYGDPDPLVRATAAATGGRAVPPRLLDDPLLAVRIAAAGSLAGVPMLAARVQPRLDEFRRAQEAMADLPAARLNLAALARSQGDLELAARELRTALTFDSGLDEARVALAGLRMRMGDVVEAEAVLRAGRPSGRLNRALGLLLAETGRGEEAVLRLIDACQQLPGDARVRYNLGLLLLQLGRSAEAEDWLRESLSLDPGNRDAQRVLARLPGRDGRRANPTPPGPGAADR